MTILKRFFSPKLYKEALSQLRLPGFIMGGALLAIMLLVIVISKLTMSKFDFTDPAYPVYTTAWLFALIYLYTAPFIISLAAFNFLNSRKRCDFYHALPVHRSALFGSFAAGVFTWLVSTILVAIFSSTILAVALGAPFIFGELLRVLVVFIPGLLFAASATMLAMSVSGTLFTNTVVTALIVWLPALLRSLFTTGVTGYVPAMPESSVTLFGLQVNNLFVSPLWFITDYLYYFDSARDALFQLLLSFLYTLIIALLYFVIAGFLFTKRKSEMAGSSAPNARMQILYRIAVALPPLVTFSVLNGLFGIDVISSLLVAITLSLILLFAFELITSRKWINLLRALPSFGIALAIALLFTTLIWGVATYAGTFAPPADQIAWVQVVKDREYLEYMSYDPELKPFRTLAKDAVQLDTETVREEASKELRRVARIPTWGKSDPYGMDYYDDRWLGDRYPIELVIKVRTTFGRTELRIVTVAYENWNYRAAYHSEESAFELTPLGEALIAATK